MSADVSAMMSSEFRRHCTYISLYKKSVFATCSHSSLYSIVLNIRALTPCILNPYYSSQNMPENTITNKTPPLHRPSYPRQITTPYLRYDSKRRRNGDHGRRRMILSCVSPVWHQVRACVLSVILAGPMH